MKNFLKNKQKIIIVGIIIFIIILGFLSLGKKDKTIQSQEYYEAAVIIEDSKYDKNPKSMKKIGDVIVIQNKDYKWSEIDRTKYLILKMDIDEDERKQLIIPGGKEIRFNDLSDEEKENIKEREKLAKENGEEYEYEPNINISAARKYAINLDKVGDIKDIDLSKGQPFFDKIYTWKIVEKRR